MRNDWTRGMPLSERLHESAKPIWRAQHAHPFVTGVGDGTLDPEIFAFWLRQDYLFLVDYARLFGLGVSRAPDLPTMTRLAQLLHEILYREMELHRSLMSDFGLTEDNLLAADKAPTTQGYTDFLIRTASTGDYVELLGALLPCLWGYSEIGQRLAATMTTQDKRYRSWIGVYADPEFAELAVWVQELLNRHSLGLPVAVLQRVERAFITSSRYELAFWEMAWVQQSWPI